MVFFAETTWEIEIFFILYASFPHIVQKGVTYAPGNTTEEINSVFVLLYVLSQIAEKFLIVINLPQFHIFCRKIVFFRKKSSWCTLLKA